MSIRFLFNDAVPTEIYTLSLHDALPICAVEAGKLASVPVMVDFGEHDPPNSIESLFMQHLRPGDIFTHTFSYGPKQRETDRKSTRLNSSHGYISYAVFCLKKNKSTKHRS